jgi:thiol:disulfide interchange protein
MYQFRLRRCFAVVGLLSLLPAFALGQQFRLPEVNQVKGLQPVADEPGGTLSVKAVFTAPADGQPAKLYITADIKKGWHVYSLTQAKGGPLPTKIKLTPSPSYKVSGDFKPTPPPVVHKYPEAYKDLPVEEHAGRVTWQAPIELAAGVDPKDLKIEGKLNVQACDATNCLPPKDYPFTAALGSAPQLPAEQKAEAPAVEKPAGTALYQAPHAQITGTLSPAVAAPGQTVQLSLTVAPDKQWHVYALAEKAPTGPGSKPTLIALTDVPAGWQASAPRTNSRPIDKPDGGVAYHEEPVTWTIDLLVPADAAPGSQTIAGLMGYQTCWASACDRPMAVRFETQLEIGAQPKAGGSSLTFMNALYGQVASLMGDSKPSSAAAAAFDPALLRSNSASGASSASVGLMMVFGFLGGLILNLMPCVLPVIGLKILSFVEQAGQGRARVLMLNIWYSLGLMAVFMVLASLTAIFGLGWGEQFTSHTFNIVMTCIVFAMALSFLGVWEIPIPGFVGSGAAQDLSSREGISGAFAKGVITTVLATPCIGPFLGTSVAWATRQPPHLIYAFFGCVGLGMASPYLLLGAFPSLVRFLPKPGAWMETFKQLMGFVLLGTVIFLLTFLSAELVVPTVGVLFGIWFACWWVGRTPYTADFGVKTRAWMAALTMVMLSALVAYNWPESNHRLPWQPFNKQQFAQLTNERKTVMVDFTADWCLVCKVLERTVLNTEDVKGVVDAHQVVPMLADWTEGDEEVTTMLELLGAKQVPVLAIFPADRPNEPIVFFEPYTQQQLIDALNKAGPSNTAAAGNATAMR